MLHFYRIELIIAVFVGCHALFVHLRFSLLTFLMRTQV